MPFIGPDTDQEAPQSGGFVGPSTDQEVPTDQGALMAAGRGAVRNFPLAPQTIAGMSQVGNMAGLGTPEYSESIQNQTAKAEAAKASHPWAYGAGAFTGAALPMAIPVIGEAAEAGYLSAAGVGAGLGAAQSISDTSLTQEPGKALGEAATGAGLGAVGGLGGKWLSKLIPTPEEGEAGALFKKTGIPSRAMIKSTGNDIIPGAQDIAETLRTPTPSGQSLNEISDSHLRLAGKVSDAIKEYGDQIGDITKDIDEPIPADILKNRMGALETTDGLKVPNGNIQKINAIIDANKDAQGNLTFKQLRALGSKIYNDMIVVDPNTQRLAPESVEAMKAWQDLRGIQEVIVQKTKPEQWGIFSNAMKNYSDLLGLSKGLNMAAIRQEAKQTSLGGTLNPLSLLSKVGNAAASATGINRVANNLPFKAMPVVSAVRGVLPKAIPQAELADYLTSKFGKKQ